MQNYKYSLKGIILNSLKECPKKLYLISKLIFSVFLVFAKH